MIALSDDLLQRFGRRIEQADRKFEKGIESAHAANMEPLGLGLHEPLERMELVRACKQRVCLECFGSLLFYWLDELNSLELAVDELRDAVNVALIIIRDLILEKWPGLILPNRDWPELKEREVDHAVITWLEALPKWREYETRIRCQLAAPEASSDSQEESPTPLMYFLRWRLEHLSADAQRRVRSRLLQIHGMRLDGTADFVECCRETYDLIAREFAQAKLLTEELLRLSIPEMVADASAGGGWPAEPLGRTQPTAIFNEQFGSQFYPCWRVEALLSLLRGRMSHWSGDLTAISSPAQGGRKRGRPPQSDNHEDVANKVAALGLDWREPDKLSRLASWMDSKGMPIENRSKPARETWKEKCKHDRRNFIKCVEYRLKRAKK